MGGVQFPDTENQSLDVPAVSKKSDIPVNTDRPHESKVPGIAVQSEEGIGV